MEAKAPQPPSPQQGLPGGQQGRQNQSEPRKRSGLLAQLPTHRDRFVPGKNLFSRQLRPASKAFRKTQRGEKPREGEGEGRMQNVSVPVSPGEPRTLQLDGGAGWRPGESSSALTSRGAAGWQFWALMGSSGERRLLCLQPTSCCLYDEDLNARTRQGTWGNNLPVVVQHPSHTWLEDRAC